MRNKSEISLINMKQISENKRKEKELPYNESQQLTKNILKNHEKSLKNNNCLV